MIAKNRQTGTKLAELTPCELQTVAGGTYDERNYRPQEWASIEGKCVWTCAYGDPTSSDERDYDDGVLI